MVDFHIASQRGTSTALASSCSIVTQLKSPVQYSTPDPLTAKFICFSLPLAPRVPRFQGLEGYPHSSQSRKTQSQGKGPEEKLDRSDVIKSGLDGYDMFPLEDEDLNSRSTY